jgi:membrane protein
VTLKAVGGNAPYRWVRTAGSLSFTTLLAIVPLITVAFSFVGRFPIFEDWLKVLEQFMLKHLLPFSAGTEIRGYITGFAEQAAQLTGVSVAIIAVSAALAMASVEREINAIWGIRRGRSLARRVVVYALGLTAVPVLIGASISITTWLVMHSLAAVSLRRTLNGIAPRHRGPAAADYRAVQRSSGAACRRRAGDCRGCAAAAASKRRKAVSAGISRRCRRTKWSTARCRAADLPLWIYPCWIIILAGAAVSASIADPAGRRSRCQTRATD